MNYDIIICVGWKDVIAVKKTVKYIRKNLSPSTIYLIMNEEDKKQFGIEYCHANGIVTIDEDKLVEGMTFKSVETYLHLNHPLLGTGWYFQQFLKIGFAFSSYAKDYYLIWDADTLPLSQISFEEKGQLMFTMKNEYHKPYFETIRRLWNLEKLSDKSFISEHMFIKSDIMKEMIYNMQKGNDGKQEWFYHIIDALEPEEQNGFSEFESYGTYVTRYYPNLYKERTLNTWRNAGIVFGRNIKDRDIELLTLDFDIISLETWSGRFFPANLFAWLQEAYVKLQRYRYMKRNGIKLQGSLWEKVFKQITASKKVVKLSDIK